MCARCLSLQALEYAESHKHKQYMGLFQVHCSALYLSWPHTEKDIGLGKKVVVAEVGHCPKWTAKSKTKRCISTDPFGRIMATKYIWITTHMYY